LLSEAFPLYAKQALTNLLRHTQNLIAPHLFDKVNSKHLYETECIPCF